MLHEFACCKTNDTNGVSALTADLAVCGMWQPQTMALIDAWINGIDSLFYVANSVEGIIALDKTEKQTGLKLQMYYRIDSLLSCIKLVDCLFGNSYSKN